MLGAEVALRALPAARPHRRRDRDGRLAGALAPADVGDRLQARPRRSQDDPGLRRPGEEPRAASPAVPAHRRRHPRGRPRHLEQLEAPAAARTVRRRRGDAPPRPQAEGAARSGSPPSRRSSPSGWAGRKAASPASPGGCPTAIGWPSRSRCSSATPASSTRPTAGPRREARSIEALVQEERGATLVIVYAKDQPGLFYRIAGAISLAGGNIIDARIHTTDDGMALDNFLVQDAERGPFADPHQLKRLEARGGAGAGRPGAVGRAARRPGAAAAPRRGLPDPAGRVRR